MKKLTTSYLILVIVLCSITITTVLADTVSITTYPYTIQDNSANQRLVILSSGNVGIGTSSPQALLHVYPPSGYGGRELAVQSWFDLSGVAGGEGSFATNAYFNNTDNALHYSNSHSTIGASGFTVNYPAWNEAGIFVNGGGSTAGASFTPHWVATFTSSGNVGIGTTNPAQTLDVNGIAMFRSSIYNDPFRTSPISGWYTDLTHNLYYNSGWRSLEGGPGSHIAIGGGSNKNSFMEFDVSPSSTSTTANSLVTLSPAMYLNNAGYVGIGTTSPLQKLDVNGNIRLSGNLTSPNDICIGTC